jgi:hypothetical protein
MLAEKPFLHRGLRGDQTVGLHHSLDELEREFRGREALVAVGTVERRQAFDYYATRIPLSSPSTRPMRVSLGVGIALPADG